MGILDNLFSSNKSEDDSKSRSGAIDYGRNKNTGGHDHRTNSGDDRTPAQKEGDDKRKK